MARLPTENSVVNGGRVQSMWYNWFVGWLLCAVCGPSATCREEQGSNIQSAEVKQRVHCSHSQSFCIIIIFTFFLCVCLVFYASPIPGVLRFPALVHLSTNQHSASSDMQLGFWRNAWEHGCDGRKALRSRCPNRNVYADWHIYRNVNYTWDAAQNPRSQLFPLKKHKHATPQEGGFYLCKNKLVLMPLWTKELINKKGKEKHGDGPRHSSVFSLVMFLSSFRFVKQ